MLIFDTTKKKQAEAYFSNTAEARLEVIYRTMNTKSFGQRYAASIVGGRGRLERLIGEGKVRAEKASDAQNGKWQCNAADVLKNAVIKYRKSRKNEKKKDTKLGDA